MMIDSSQHLDDLVQRLDRVEADIRALASLPAEARQFAPEAGRWSIDQCLDHLCITAEIYRPRLRAALDRAPQDDVGPREFKAGFFGRRFAQLSGPNSRTRVKAPKIFQPSHAEAIEDPARRLLAAARELRGFIGEARHVDLGRVRVPTPIPLLRLQLGVCLDLLVGHQQRHLKQAQAVREDPGFPS